MGDQMTIEELHIGQVVEFTTTGTIIGLSGVAEFPISGPQAKVSFEYQWPGLEQRVTGSILVPVSLLTVPTLLP